MPLVGTYHIGIYAYRTYSNLSLTMYYTVGGTTNSETISFATTVTNIAENIVGGNVVVSVTRTGGSNGAVSVDYSTIDTGTAISGSDYQTTVGSIVFAPGEIQKRIIIPIINDNLVEGTENFNVVLTNVTGGALLGTNTHTVLITDDEPLAGAVLSVSFVKSIKLLQFSWTAVPGAIKYMNMQVEQVMYRFQLTLLAQLQHLIMRFLFINLIG